MKDIHYYIIRSLREKLYHSDLSDESIKSFIGDYTKEIYRYDIKIDGKTQITEQEWKELEHSL